MRINSFKLLLAALSLVAVCGGAMAQKSTTGQGIQVTLSGGGVYTYTATDTYKFNKGNAAAFYSNDVVSGATINVNGNVDLATWLPTLQAATPAAPAPDASVVTGSGNAGNNGLTGADRCNFLDGGALEATADYTQSIKTDVQCGTKTQGREIVPNMVAVTYTWSYHAQPNVAGVDPFTCWDLVSSVTDGSADVSIGGQVAGESVMSSKQHPRKYSFSLDDGFGGNRVANLMITMNNVSYPTTSSMVTGADFMMANFNAGTNGAISLLQVGDARTILNTDSFPGNDNGGTDGKALAYAEMAPVTFYGLGTGDYTVTVTGTVKGNSAVAQTTFSVATLITIVTPGCGGN